MKLSSIHSFSNAIVPPVRAGSSVKQGITLGSGNEKAVVLVRLSVAVIKHWPKAVCRRKSLFHLTSPS